MSLVVLLIVVGLSLFCTGFSAGISWSNRMHKGGTVAVAWPELFEARDKELRRLDQVKPDA